MQYNVAQLLKEPTGATRTYQVQQRIIGVPGIIDRVHGQLDMLRTHEGILVNAKLDIESNLMCSRCLREFTRPSTLFIEEECFPAIDLHTGRQLPPTDEEEVAFRIDDTHTLDLHEVLRQYVISDSLMKPLCHPDCPGLCQHCGVNFNQTRCECDAGPRDQRWAALAALLDK
jgi:uncharacterized protein